MSAAPAEPALLRICCHCWGRVGDVVGEHLSEVLCIILHCVGRYEASTIGCTLGLVEPVTTDVARLRDESKVRAVRLLLIENVGELVMHRVEVVGRHRLVVGQSLVGERIDLP